MASRMKSWHLVGLTGVGISLVALALLPPRSAREFELVFGGPRERPLRPAAEKLTEARREVFTAYGALQRFRMESALVPLLEDAPEGSGPAPLHVRADLHEAAVDGLEARLRAVTRGLPGRDDVAVGVFVVDPSAFWSRTDVWGGLGAGMDIFVGDLPDGRSYCMSVIRWRSFGKAPGPRVAFLDDDAAGNPLGPCWLWLAHGPPGDAVADWMDEGGVQFGVRRFAPPATTMFPIWRGHFGSRLDLATAERGLWLPWDSEACLRRDARVCEQVVLGAETLPDLLGRLISDREARSRDETGFIADVADLPRVTFGVLTPGLLASLEAREGPDAFGRFWRSDAPVAAAFQEAFGRDLGPWVQSWLRDHYPAVGAGPRVDAKTAGLSLLTILAALGIGIGTQRTRRVG